MSILSFFGNLPKVEILIVRTYSENDLKKSLIEIASQPQESQYFFQSKKDDFRVLKLKNT